MKNPDISALSSRYSVRPLTEEDLPPVYALCVGNPLFYRHNGRSPSLDELREDLRITPPGIPLSQKYYLGFFTGETLLAVMDLIDGYPEADIAFLGFFMMNPAFQGRGLGSALIAEAAEALRQDGFRAIRLAIDKGNPQSTRFWQKNGFTVLRELPRDGRTVLLAERLL